MARRAPFSGTSGTCLAVLPGFGLAVAAAIGPARSSSAQDGAGPLDRLRTLPGVQAHEAMQERLREGPVFVSGALNVALGGRQPILHLRPRWRAPPVRCRRRGRTLVSEADRAPTATGHGPDGAADAAIRSGRVRTGDPDPCPVVVVDRGRQRSCETSPDRTRKAYYRDHNLYLSRADGTEEVAVTTDGERLVARQVRRGELGVRRGTRPDGPRSGGRQTDRRWPSTGSTSVPCRTTTSRWTRPASVARGRRGLPEGRRAAIRSRTSSSTTSRRAARCGSTCAAVSPFADDVVGLLRLRRRMGAGRPGDSLLPHRSPAAAVGVRRLFDPATGAVSRDRARKLADRMGREPAGDSGPGGRPALPAGVGPHRLAQLLPVRLRAGPASAPSRACLAPRPEPSCAWMRPQAGCTTWPAMETTF